MSFTDFFSLTVSDFSVFLTVIITLAVAFVNGWTDAPNAIASSVVTRSLTMKKAVLVAAFADFSGAVIMGLLNGRVTETIIGISDFGSDSRVALLSLSAAMSAVVIWATAAWYFGIPTSESHALIAGITGAGIAVNKGFGGIDSAQWIKVIYGLAVSVLLGFVLGYFISRLTVIFFKDYNKEKADKIFKRSQILASIFMAFMHGAQDAQKFVGILMLTAAASGKGEFSGEIPVWMLMLCSAVISTGTATGGGRIIKSVGMDMLKLRKDQGFSADLAGAVSLLVSTVFGLPVSTTHTKTSAVLGVGVAKSIKSVNWSVAGEMVLAWFLTFPGCGLLGWAVCCVFLKIF